jgi:hypothetical protein
MKRTALAVAASAAALSIGAVTAPLAQASGLHVTLSTTKPKASGQFVTAHVTGGKPRNADYLCIFSMDKAGVKQTAALAYTPSFDKFTFNKHGAATCKMFFSKFSVPQKFKGKKLTCPPTKAEKKAGWKCGVAVANFVTRKAGVFAPFKF